MTAVLVSVGVILMALLVGVPTWYFSHSRDAERRQIEGREITAIAALREGEPARIRGVVAAGEPLLTSKLGKQTCSGYQTFIVERRGTLDVEVWARAVWPSFLVTDETGTVAVKGRLMVLLDPDGGGQDLPPVGYALLAENQERTNEHRKFQFREKLLRVGDRVSVVGRPSRGIGPAVTGSSSSPAYAMNGTKDEPVVVMDDDEAARALLIRPLPVLAPDSEAPVHDPLRRAIAGWGTTAIAALAEGASVKIRGVAAAREALLTSPVSGRACIGYRITVARSGHGSSPVVRRQAWPSFLVADETGTAAVEGPFSILLDADDGGWAALPPSVYALLEEAKVPVTGRFGRVEEFEFQETLLQVGDRVGVVGRPSLEIDAAGRGTSREPPRLYVVRGSDEEPVAVVDDDQPIG